MNFIVREAQEQDLNDLLALSKQFSLLNLPPDRKSIEARIDRSHRSFSRQLPIEEALYMFVIEDLEQKSIVGSSQIKAKHGTEKNPTYSFEVLKKERFSQALGVGFIHQVLRLKINTDGPTEVGGLVVSNTYRRRPEKVGRQISLCRFLYMALCAERFSQELHSEMAPPLTDDGRSEFWEALGRRFTGMPYQEADTLSHTNKEFIRALFPEEDIYLCLLDAKARLVLGRVGERTQAALHMLQRLGFKNKNEVDPFDGGPHLGALTKEISLIRDGKAVQYKTGFKGEYTDQCLVGVVREGMFRGGQSLVSLDGDGIYLPEKTQKVLELEQGEKLFCSPLPN